MSEIAGKIATQAGAFFLEKPLGGRGILLGGVPGSPAATVMVIGGGAVGMNAAFIAIGMEADVFVYDVSIDRLRELDVAFGGRASTVFSSTLAIEEMLPRADLVIGAVLVHGARAPYVVRREQLALMKKEAVLVDVAIDQGGCFETSHPTTHRDPVFEVDGITHYCVANMPGAVPITATYALTNATLPYVLALADHGVAGRLGAIRGFASASTSPPVGSPIRPSPRELASSTRRSKRCSTKDRKPDQGGRSGHRNRNAQASKSRNSKPRARALKNMIDGEFVAPVDGKREDVIDPATGEVIAKAPLSGKRDVDAAVKAARTPSTDGRTTTPGERAIALLKIADAIEERAEEIADLEAADAGKPRSAFLEDEIPFMVDNLRYFAGAGLATWRVGPPASTSRATPRGSAGSRSASSVRSRRGTTR